MGFLEQYGLSRVVLRLYPAKSKILAGAMNRNLFSEEMVPNSGIIRGKARPAPNLM